MENKTAKLHQAKMFMDYLAAGVDPVSNEDADADTLHNEEILSCFRFISDVLSDTIAKAESGAKKKRVFFITAEQYAQLVHRPDPCKVSDIAAEINRVTEENGTRDLVASWINDWLEAQEYLCREGTCRIASEKGAQLGISSEKRQREDGTGYFINFYSEQAQHFVFDHIDDIVLYHSELKNAAFTVPDISYPSGMPLRDFISQHSDKCFIMSVGFHVTVTDVGSYTAVLLFKGRSKIISRTNVSGRSAHKCMLAGMLAAADAIKAPTDVVLLSPTALGFDPQHRKNRQFCKDIYRTLTEKGCNIFTAVCAGKDNELYSLVRSLE